jgi:hypothetical protein
MTLSEAIMKDKHYNKTLDMFATPIQGLEVNYADLSWHDINDKPTDPRDYVITDCYDVLSVATYLPEENRFDTPFDVIQWAEAV